MVTPYRLAIGAASALAACLLALPGAAAPAAASPDAGPLVAKVVAAYGGKAALARVRAVREQGKVASPARGGARGTLLRVLGLPDSLRVEIAFPRETPEVRIVHEGRGIRQGRDVTGTPPHVAMVLQAARLALPLWLAADPARARAAGTETREGVRYEVLAVDVGGGAELRADVDPRTGRVVRTVGAMAGPGGGRLEFVNLYSDFREVKGVLFAFREENFAAGQRTGETVLELVEPLAEAPPGAFDPAPTIRL